MLRVVWFAMLLTLLAPAWTLAGGVNITWGVGCWNEFGSVLKTFSCATNDGAATATGSLQPGYALGEVVGGRIVLDLECSAAPLPDWWLLAAGRCRAGSLQVSFDFSTAPGIVCSDPWGSAVPSWSLAQTDGEEPGARESRSRLEIDFASNIPVAFTPYDEHYLFRVRLDYARSTGANSCSGCSTPCTLRLSGVGLWQADGSRHFFCFPLTNQCLMWHEGGPVLCPYDWVPPPGFDCAAVPARAPTWGGVKSLYR